MIELNLCEHFFVIAGAARHVSTCYGEESIAVGGSQARSGFHHQIKSKFKAAKPSLLAPSYQLRLLKQPMTSSIMDNMRLRPLAELSNCQFLHSAAPSSKPQTSDKSIDKTCFSWHQWHHRWEVISHTSAASLSGSAQMRPSATSVSASVSARLTIDPNKKTE